MSNLSRFKNLKTATPASKPEVVVDSWEQFVTHVCKRSYSGVTDSEHTALEPYKLKFESGEFTIYGPRTIFREILDILY